MMGILGKMKQKVKQWLADPYGLQDPKHDRQNVIEWVGFSTPAEYDIEREEVPPKKMKTLRNVPKAARKKSKVPKARRLKPKVIPEKFRLPERTPLPDLPSPLLTEFDFDNDEGMVILGSKGTGKSYFVKHKVLPQLTRYIIADPDYEYEWCCKKKHWGTVKACSNPRRLGTIVESFDEFKEALDSQELRIVIQATNREAWTKLMEDCFNYYVELVKQRYKKEEPYQSYPVIIDEVQKFGNKKYTTHPMISAISTEGRKYEIPVIVISQRPQNIHNDLLDLIVHWIIFRVQWSSLKNIEQLDDSIKDQVKIVKRFKYVYYSTKPSFEEVEEEKQEENSEVIEAEWSIAEDLKMLTEGIPEVVESRMVEDEKSSVSDKGIPTLDPVVDESKKEYTRIRKKDLSKLKSTISSLKGKITKMVNNDPEAATKEVEFIKRRYTELSKSVKSYDNYKYLRDLIEDGIDRGEMDQDVLRDEGHMNIACRKIAHDSGVSKIFTSECSDCFDDENWLEKLDNWFADKHYEPRMHEYREKQRDGLKWILEEFGEDVET